MPAKKYRLGEVIGKLREVLDRDGTTAEARLRQVHEVRLESHQMARCFPYVTADFRR